MLLQAFTHTISFNPHNYEVDTFFFFLATLGGSWDLNSLTRDPTQASAVKSAESSGASLVAQWLRILLPMQETQVQALVREDPTR